MTILEVHVSDTPEGFRAALGPTLMRWKEVWTDGTVEPHVMSISTEGIVCTAPTREQAVRELAQVFQDLLFEPIRQATRK
jgi:hypothetical protein